VVVTGSVDLFRMLMGAGVLARAGWVGSIVGQMLVVLKRAWYLDNLCFCCNKVFIFSR
jgi:hypothetical protein